MPQAPGFRPFRLLWLVFSVWVFLTSIFLQPVLIPSIWLSGLTRPFRLRLAKRMGFCQAHSSPCSCIAQLSHSILQGPTKYNEDKRRSRLDWRPTTRSCQIEKFQFSISKRLFVILWTVACQAPLSLAFLLSKNTRVNRYFLFQGIFLTQKSNSHLLHWWQTLCRWATWEALKKVYMSLFFHRCSWQTSQHPFLWT